MTLAFQGFQASRLSFLTRVGTEAVRAPTTAPAETRRTRACTRRRRLSAAIRSNQQPSAAISSHHTRLSPARDGAASRPRGVDHVLAPALVEGVARVPDALEPRAPEDGPPLRVCAIRRDQVQSGAIRCDQVKQHAAMRPPGATHQSSVISHQPSVISHQARRVPRRDMAISHQPSVISHQARRVPRREMVALDAHGVAGVASSSMSSRSRRSKKATPSACPSTFWIHPSQSSSRVSNW